MRTMTTPEHDPADAVPIPPGIPVIGLAGGIGAGKSAVAAELAALGCVVTNSDADAKALLDDPDVRAELVRWWGESILDTTTGQVDRRAVAERVFADPEQRRRLEELIHPRVEHVRRAAWARAAGERAVSGFVIDAPLLFEAGLDAACDAVIFVDVPRDERQRRVSASRGWKPEELDRREKSQWALDLKRRRSDHVIDNSRDHASLRREVEAVFKHILKDIERKVANSGRTLENPPRD